MIFPFSKTVKFCESSVDSGGLWWTEIQWSPVESTRLHLKMSPPLSEKVSLVESARFQLDSVGEGKVLGSSGSSSVPAAKKYVYHIASVIRV